MRGGGGYRPLCTPVTVSARSAVTSASHVILVSAAARQAARHSIVIVMFVFFMPLLLHPQFIFAAVNRDGIHITDRYRKISDVCREIEDYG
jgi:hypothetical protein